MSKTRVLIVEDSATVRDRLRTILAADPEVEVVGEAADGADAVELCRKQRPDVVTMDMMLPGMNGLAATEHIMAHSPTPILIVSSSFNRGELFRTYDALAAGAVDVLEKPRGDEPEGDWEHRFLSTLKLVSRIRVITHPRARLRGFASAPVGSMLPAAPPAVPVGERRLVAVGAIGASTGGPSAIVEVLRGIPAEFAAPILLVLHINALFGAGFAEWLDGQSPRRAALAKDGEPLVAAAGRVLMAPPDLHMVVHDGRIHLNHDPERHSCRPSIDVLFESIAREYGPSAIACLLTGMGRDGASGLLAMRNASALTIAQDEASSVVYGMPREAARLGAAIRVLPLAEIGAAFGSMTRRMEGGSR